MAKNTKKTKEKTEKTDKKDYFSMQEEENNLIRMNA